MSELYIFERYPVRNHDMPRAYESYFSWFFSCGYEILKERADVEVAQLVWEIDKYTAEGVSYLSDVTRPRVLHDPSDLYPGRMQIVSIQRAMSDGVLPSEVSSLPDISWLECLAAALLGHCMFALDAETRYREGEFKNSDLFEFYDDLSEYMGYFSISCMEILMVLSIQPGQSAYTLPYNMLNSKRVGVAKKAAEARHKATNDIKQDFIRWFLSENGVAKFKSRIKAAEIFLSRLPKERQDLIKDPDTLVKALRAHLKSL